MRTPKLRNNYWLMEDDFEEIVESIIKKRYDKYYNWEFVVMDDNTFDVDVFFSDEDDDCESIVYSEIVEGTSEYFGRDVMAIIRLSDPYYNEYEFVIDLGYAEV